MTFFSEMDYASEQMKKILKYPDYFKVAELFTVEDLFDARVHMGHTEGSLDDHMKQFVFGSRLGHLIIDLDQTAALLRDALNFTAHIAFRGGIILFVGRTAQHQVSRSEIFLKLMEHLSLRKNYFKLDKFKFRKEIGKIGLLIW